MNRAQAESVDVGDEVSVDDLWNRTERPPNQIPVPTPVLEVVRGRSQTGISFTVATQGGGRKTLDAGWFVA